MKKQFINITYLLVFVFLLIWWIFYLNSKNQSNDLKLDTEWSKLVNSWNFSWAIVYYENKVKENNTYENKVFLIDSYLEYGNSFYKEAEYSKKALTILNTMEDKYDVFYFKWYANEIIKNYTWALTYYKKWLEIKDLDNKKKSALLNQIGHLYDLKWDIETAYKNYKEAYTIYNENYIASINIGRYLARKWNFKESIIYFKQWLNTEFKPIKSEVYYSLSTIELELNLLKPDINKSIEYAKKSIEEYPSYAMWYMALWRWYYMLNDKKYYKEIEKNLTKSIELNPNWYEAYSYASLDELDRDEYETSIKLLTKSIEVVNKDMILMDNIRNNVINEIKSKMLIIAIIDIINKNWKINMKELWEKFNKIPFWKDFIKTQLKRNNNWLFNKVEWINEYVKKYK